MSNIDFSELILSKKGVVLSNRQVVGNIIGERDDSIIVEKDKVSENVYTIPKSKIESYDGTQLTLKSTETELRAFEQKRENTGESVLGNITDKLEDVKDKVVGTTKDLANKTKDTIASTSSIGQEQSSGGDRLYEEGGPGTDTSRNDDPLSEYRDKEPMTPAKINTGEPTAVKRDPSDQKITSEGQTGTNTQEAQEEYRKRGMTKVDSDSHTHEGSSVNQSKQSSSEVDNGRNSDENSTNVKATFSCETCGQTFDSRQVLKEHTSMTHYK
ncbi:hypothetical protein [Candidatus Nitrosocosmicus sp. T]